jgi:hypothetical protein
MKGFFVQKPQRKYKINGEKFMLSKAEVSPVFHPKSFFIAKELFGCQKTSIKNEV